MSKQKFAYNIDTSYYYGNGTTFERKAQLFQNASMHANTLFALAPCYKNVTTRDPKADVQRYANALFNLALSCKNETGNDQKVVELFQKAAEQGHARAQFNLASCYKNGIGVKKDVKRAIELYQKAAEQGNTYAQHCLEDYNKRKIFVWRK